MKISLLKRTGFILCYLMYPLFCIAQLSEKIHIQTDKTTYFEGETVWFKAYLYYGNRPSLVSTNFYIGLYDDEGKLLQEKKFPVIDGTCAGDFTIPDSINSNYIRIAGKTINSLSPEIIPLKIYRSGSVFPAPANNNDGVSVYAENSRPGFELNNHFVIKSFANGNPLETAGALYNNAQQFVDSFYTDASGYTGFQLTPKAGTWYYLQWKDKAGNIQKKDLPSFSDPGAVLHAEQANGRLYFSIQTAGNESRFANMHLLLLNGNDTLYTAGLALKNTLQATASVELTKLGKGLAQIQLLDADQNILQHRNILLRNESFLPVVRHSKKSFSPKGENTIAISSSKLAGYDLSLSISDIVFTDKKLSHLLEDDLWMDSFDGNALHKALMAGDDKLIDRIILSDGVQPQFSGMPFKKDNYLDFILEYNNNGATLASAEKAGFIVADRSGKKQFFNAAADTKNRFSLNGLIFYDSAKAYYSFLSNKDLNDKLKVIHSENNILPAIIDKLATTTTLKNDVADDAVLFNTYYEKRPEKFNQFQTIQNVVVKSKKVNTFSQRLNELEDRYATGMFRGTTKGFQLNVLDDPGAETAPDIFSYLGSRLGLFVRGGTVGSRRLAGLRGTPQLYIDEVQLLDEDGGSLWDILEQYRPSNLAYVKYIPGIVINGAGYTADGVVYVYTRKGKDLDPKDLEGKGMLTTVIKGYDIYREFQSPDYSDKKSQPGIDYRTTLYWNPYINTEGKTTLEIKYFNNDISTRHLLVLKGFDEEGMPFEIRQILE